MSDALPRLHRHWLEREALRLLDFGRPARLEGGAFGWLDARGAVTPGKPQYLYVAGRMTHVYALGSLLGVPGAAPIAEHGIRSLTELFRDRKNGGWFTSLDEKNVPLDVTKSSYAHSFVILAGASGAVAGVPGAGALLADALQTVEEHFWEEEPGAVREQWDETFTEELDYRGLNATMHMVEAYLAAYTALGDPVLLERCVRMCDLALTAARKHDWRLPEHFTRGWVPVLDHNAERRDDPFKPYGSTIGHWFEWARLALQTEQALVAAGLPVPGVLRESAVALFDRACVEGWHVDGTDGFVYTVDWEGRPAVRSRLHWVVAEAIGAAATLWSVTGDASYRRWYRTWWDYAATHLVDAQGGSWHHELDSGNRPAATIKEGKADVYHALQATLVPALPVRAGLALAVRDSTGA